ncbi:MAG: COX15/CtaA family protein [Bacteroidota bacterium]
MSIFAVILAGSFVRMTGSGMGCPDWPKCFGQYIPPTSIDQLPADYKETFRAKRQRKLERFISTLEGLGFESSAQKMRDYEADVEEENFVALKTWIEFINRLMGALAGIFLVLGLVLSFKYWRKDKWIPILSLLTLLATSFQGWLGSIVVATHLLPGMVTVHMSFALIVIALLVLILVKDRPRRVSRNHKWKYLIGGAILISLVQIYFGTQVRQEIDLVAKAFENRADWISQLSNIFFTHRSFAILLVLINGVIVYLFWKEKRITKAVLILGGLVLMEVLSGIVLSYLDMPKLMQPTHLFLACCIFAIQVYLMAKFKAQKVRLT